MTYVHSAVQLRDNADMRGRDNLASATKDAAAGVASCL